MTNPIRAMVFDADGVIVRPRTWFVHAAERTYRIPRAEFMGFIHGDFKRCTTGELELSEVLPPLLERWQVNVGVDAFIRQWLIHEHALDINLLERIARIRARGMPCYLGTNQERHRAAYMRRDMGLQDALDGVFASSDLGVRKPDAAFYERVQEALHLEPHQILFWDDAAQNVEAARAVGWQAELYTGLRGFDQHLLHRFGWRRGARAAP
ncbi:MAG: HAD-IA family hydrolase [Pleurocapsa sp. SU_196_0]|nr:HAD-IA family hydrolase [Pleurocapsa sp. SU_196_0]